MKAKQKITQIARIVPNSSDMAEAYYFWLCDIIQVNPRGKKSYWLLAKALHAKMFYWSVPNDDNRAFEAKNLRERFCETNGRPYIYENFTEDVSMLELIIALAYRCEDIMAGQISNLYVRDWFWKMMTNVGLDKVTDDVYYNWHEDGTVDEILDRIIDRTYKRTGQGGLFPLLHSKKDQRKVELWYQMSVYLVENYYTGDICL